MALDFNLLKRVASKTSSMNANTIKIYRDTSKKVDTIADKQVEEAMAKYGISMSSIKSDLPDMVSSGFDAAQKALAQINPIGIFNDVKQTVEETTDAKLGDLKSKYGENALDVFKEEAANKADETTAKINSVTDKVTGYVDALKDPQKIIDDLMGTYNSAMDLMDSFKNGKISTEKDINKAEDKANEIMDKVNEVGDTISTIAEIGSTAGDAISAVTDPAGFAKRKIAEMIFKSDYVTTLKDNITAKIKEDLMKIPEIEELVEQVKNYINQFYPDEEKIRKEIEEETSRVYDSVNDLPSLDSIMEEGKKEAESIANRNKPKTSKPNDSSLRSGPITNRDEDDSALEEPEKKMDEVSRMSRDQYAAKRKRKKRPKKKKKRR